VQDGILYNRRVIGEDSHFWGMVKVSDDLYKTFSDFITMVGATGLVRIGTGRTRGMGKVELHMEDLEDESRRYSDFHKRLEAFNERLKTHIPKAFKKPVIKAEKPFYFALTLHSPAILRDHLLRYAGMITAEMLAQTLGKPDQSFQLIHQAASMRRIAGWNDLWGTPKTNDLAIDTGSVFLFSSDLPQKDLEQALFKLEQDGLGLRCLEGFGRVCVSDAFHQEVELR
jgi:CRISPR-associated Csx10 family RAMP protein